MVSMLRSGISQSPVIDTIGTGEEELDKMLLISGNDKKKIKEWLNSSQRRGALKKIYRVLPSISVNSEGLRLQERYSKVDFSRIQNNLKLMSETILNLKID